MLVYVEKPTTRDALAPLREIFLLATVAAVIPLAILARERTGPVSEMVGLLGGATVFC
jgi:hypothetical protein